MRLLLVALLLSFSFQCNKAPEKTDTKTTTFVSPKPEKPTNPLSPLPKSPLSIDASVPTIAASTRVAAELQLDFEFIRGENSKDSNSSQYVIKIQGTSIQYAGPVRPCERGQCGRGSVQFQLNTDEVDTIITSLKKGNLLAKFSEKKDTQQLGGYNKITLKAKIKGHSSSLHISGMRIVHGSKAAEKHVFSSKAAHFSEGLYSLRSTLLFIARPHLPDAL